MSILRTAFALALSAVVSGAAYADTLNLSADMRLAYLQTERDERDGSRRTNHRMGSRIRVGAEWQATEIFSTKARWAGFYQHRGNDFRNRFFTELPEGQDLPPGNSTMDELYVQASYGDWRHRVGRFQYSAYLVGVAEKSLSRTNSTNMTITWTDGLHSRYSGSNGWDVNMIVHRNTGDGATVVRRAPLSFEDRDSRASYYLSVDSTDTDGIFAQRSLDVTYLPSTLYHRGLDNPSHRDYLAVTGRLALQWPLLRAARLIWGFEGGYAPNTPLHSVVNLPRSGYSSGTAFQTSLNVMDFQPGHSLGLVYGETGAGWLLSTDYGANQELLELRYQWRVMQGHTFHARIRQREDRSQLNTAERRRAETDMYLRYTISL